MQEQALQLQSVKAERRLLAEMRLSQETKYVQSPLNQLP